MNKFSHTFSYKVIYVFTIFSETHKGLLKIGEATIGDTNETFPLEDNSEPLKKAAINRINEYTRTAGINYQLLHTTLAIDFNGNAIRDNDVHKVLKRSGIEQPKKELNGATEWFKVDLETIKKAIEATKAGRNFISSSSISFDKTPVAFRPEQTEAITKTLKVFKKAGNNTNAQMLWNAKMRFGKTLSALQVAKEMNFSNTLIITHRPVVKQSWFEDFDKIFYDKKEFLYGSKTQGESLDNLLNLSNKHNKKIVYFASIQDLRGSKVVGGKHDKNDILFSFKWDFVIIDEAHEGTQTTLGNEVIQTLISSKASTKALYLSGTPFNLLAPESKQTFSEEEVYTWDYVNEQRAKLEWIINNFGDSNPYESLPKMNIFVYDLAEIITNNIYKDIQDKAFNFREFFRVRTGDLEKDSSIVEKNIEIGSFVYEKDILKFLDLLVEPGNNNYPYSSKEYRDNFRHTLWMVPGVKEAKALSKLLKNHSVFKFFDIINVAGSGDEEVKYDDALKLVKDAISDKPEETHTITLSCGRLTTGVSVPAWTAVFMLSGSSSTAASSYLQTIFRVQTPAIISGRTKTNCYVFDFAPDRTLKMVAEAGRISTKVGSTNSDNKQMGDFLNFCPVIGLKGSEMVAYNTENMLIQLKKAFIERVARNGFDDRYLYNDNLLKLSDIEIAKFEKLKTILKTSKKTLEKNNVLINDQGLDEEQLDNKKTKVILTEDEKKIKQERLKRLRERANAISILRGVAIRIPLLIYGVDIGIDQEIDTVNFVNLIDENSWSEFMPKGVTKTMFLEFSKYFDNEVFVQAGLRIRRQAKAADDLPPLERVQAIADLFSTFKNPDKETVLTPWKAVNMHMGTCIGGANFFDNDYKNQIRINENTSTRWIEKPLFSNEIFSTKSKILEINSKTGLYPLYAAISIYQKVKIKGHLRNVTRLWNEILSNNIYVVCRTNMAKSITERTLKGFMNGKEFKTNIIVIENITEQMSKTYKDNYSTLVKFILEHKDWSKGESPMKFNAIIGNPPYQGEAKQQIYADFYLLSQQLGDVVSLIFPIGWQEPKSANNLSKLNNATVKKDKQIVFIDNRQNVFPGISGAEWTNFILWKRNYDNELDGAQLIFVDGQDPQNKILPIEKNDYVKPTEINKLVSIIKRYPNFQSMQSVTSTRKPYGLSTDFFDNPSKYMLPKVSDSKNNNNDIVVFGSQKRTRVEKYIPLDYPLPKKSLAFNKFKVFVPYAWGGMDENKWLGGTFSDIIVGRPNEIVTESYQEQGSYENFKKAYYHAKYILTKFARACLYANKYSQHSTTSWGAVPVQDFDEEWWDKSINEIDNYLFEKYNIDPEIKNFVLKSFQQKNEDNIFYLKN